MFKKDKNMNLHIINKNLYKKLLHKIEQIYTNILIILIQRIHLSYIKKKKKNEIASKNVKSPQHFVLLLL